MPDNVQSAMLRCAGCSRTNHNQFIPYMSKDITDHAQVYQLVKKILRDVFDWLAEKVSTLMFKHVDSILNYWRSWREFFPMNMQDWKPPHISYPTIAPQLFTLSLAWYSTSISHHKHIEMRRMTVFAWSFPLGSS